MTFVCDLEGKHTLLHNGRVAIARYSCVHISRDRTVIVSQPFWCDITEGKRFLANRRKTGGGLLLSGGEDYRRGATGLGSVTLQER